jgi:hypothetical protein
VGSSGSLLAVCHRPIFDRRIKHRWGSVVESTLDPTGSH